MVEEFITQFLDLISLEVDAELWGIFYDILWCSEFCHNSGTCGNLGNGLGTSPAATTTPTTTQATSTVKPADCSTRSELIIVTQQNTTVLTDVLTVNYNSWNASTRLSFNTCFNQVRNDIWNDVAFPTPGANITDIVKNFKSYNANNLSKQQVLMSISIEVRNDIWNDVAFPTYEAKITDIVKNFKSYNANYLSKQQVLMNISIEFPGGDKVKLIVVNVLLKAIRNTAVYPSSSHSKRGSDHKIGADEFTKSELNYAAMIQLMNAVTLVPTPCVANTQKSLSAFDNLKSSGKMSRK